MTSFFKNPITIIFALIIALILVLTFDLFNSASVYLYFSTEIGILLFSLAVYRAAFQGKKWDDPPEKDDERPRPDWKKFAQELSLGFVALAVILAAVWIITGFTAYSPFKVWLKKGAWSLYYAAIFGISIVLIKKYLKYIHALAMVVTTIIMVLLLTTYEIILLAHQTGWYYNNTVIGWFLGVPVDNVLFIYPVAPALAIIFYAVVTRHLNDLKAFWLINLILVPASIIVELVGIYPLDIWTIYNNASVLPLGKTDLEEFLYYILFQFLAIALYVFFCARFKKERPA